MSLIDAIRGEDYRAFKTEFGQIMSQNAAAAIQQRELEIGEEVPTAEGELEESVVEIPTTDFDKVEKGAKKLGLKYKTDKSDGVVDITVRDASDKKKLKTWMLKNGWDKVDIEDAFSELK